MNETMEMLSIKNLTMEDAVEQAHNIQHYCSDYMLDDVTSRTCYFDPNMNGLSFTHDGEHYRLSLTPYALGQLCGKMGVPSSYVKKLIENGYGDLAAENLNTFLDDYHKSLFVRRYTDSVRGILSDRYSTMDAPDVLDVVSDTFDDDYMLKGMYLSPERMHLRVVQKEMMNIEGEDLFAGVTIDSSDVGRSTLRVQFFIYKQVCTNGLCLRHSMGNIFTQRHIGLSKKEFHDDLVANLHRVPEVADKTMHMIRTANTYSKDLIDFNKFSEEKQKHFVSRIRALTKLPEDGVARVIDNMYNNYSVSRWGLINSLTEVAQDYTLERRLEIETAAGDILTDSRLLVA